MSYNTMETILEWLLVATAIPATLFVLAYAVRSPWWVSHYGRALLMQSTAVALLVDMTVWFHWWPPTALNTMFAAQAVAFGWSAISTTYLLLVLLWTQFHSARERSE